MDDSFLKVFFNTFKGTKNSFEKSEQHNKKYINLLNSSRHPYSSSSANLGKKNAGAMKSGIALKPLIPPKS